MAGYSTVLIAERSDTLDSTGKAYCQSICAAAQRMDTLVQDLLEFGGVGHVTLNLTKIKLQEILDDVLARVAQQIAATEAEVKVIGPLPELCADARILERILEHLLDNALKFVATNNKPSITIRAETQHGSVRLWVDDHGIGIDPLYHKRIFGAFETLHPPGTFEGTGIGLAIVKQGMERMGGKAGVESESGKGSRFWLQFEKQPPKLISGDENSRS
jgi:signal transduction histidine kinase